MQKRKSIIGTVIVIHLVVILLAWLLPGYLNRMKLVKAPPDAMFVSLVAPQPSMPDVAPLKDITPEPLEPKKEVAPPKPKKKKIEISRKKITRQADPKPKKTLTAEELKKLMQVNRATRSTSTTKAPLPAWYYASVRDILYGAWSQPTSISAAAGHQVKVQLQVSRDGRITAKDVLHRSGHPDMDKSVQAALASVQRLKALPSQFKGSSVAITITFELNRG